MMDLNISIMFFTSDSLNGNDLYGSFLAAGSLADQLGYKAVWIPERHFNRFGGLFPNPAIVAAALAMLTKRVRLRAGSVVLPLHNPIRIAEEWAIVDQLSRGRVDLAFAQGWNTNDFAIMPEAFSDRLNKMYQGFKDIVSLWRAQGILVQNGSGDEVMIQTYPLPYHQPKSFWLTCVGSNERFIEAGKLGMNVLTGLLFQSLDELQEKIKLYKEARKQAGYDPDSGEVTLMLHTYAASNEESCIEVIRKPLKQYLMHSIDLWKDNFVDLAHFNGNKELLLELAFQRYYQMSGLFGTAEDIQKRAQSIQQVGVTEIACLVDFGVNEAQLQSSLRIIANALQLKEVTN